MNVPNRDGVRESTPDEVRGDIFAALCDVLSELQTQVTLLKEQNALLKKISEK